MSIAAPIPPNEAERLAALRNYAILDTKPDEAFDDLTRIASQICGTPMAIVSLVDQDRQWFKSEVGIETRETPRELAFCAHAILQPDVFIVPDAREDVRFHDNALVTGAPHIRFYAGAPLCTPDGHALGTLCVLDRIPRELDADQKEALAALARQAIAQMELRRSLQEADRAGRFRSRLMATIGHDLKQPLNTIKMTLDLLAAEEPSAEEQELMGYAHSAIEALSSDLDALAEASRFDGENVKITKVALQRVMNSIDFNWQLRVRQKGLKFHIIPTNAIVETDEELLGTIIGNLVGNAIKYTDRGGVLLGLRRSGNDLRIEVWDTGRGIPEDERRNIFEAFKQLDQHSEGLGLGLSIARRAATLLGYEIEVRSRPGKGSCFSVRIKQAVRNAKTVSTPQAGYQ